jgi:excisionase family DNA binding protein
MTAALADVVVELRRQAPNPESVAHAVLGDLSTDEQREAAYAAFAEFVRLTCEGMRPRAYSVATTSVLLDVPDKTVYQMVADGEIGHVRLGRHIRIPDFEVQRLLGSAVPDGKGLLSIPGGAA